VSRDEAQSQALQGFHGNDSQPVTPEVAGSSPVARATTSLKMQENGAGNFAYFG
jgi:hypothetical protein